MKLTQVAAQLYTLREHCKTAETFAASMKKVRAIGYTAVQISGVGPIPEDEIVRICKGEGLTICATHEGGKVICEEPQKVIDRLGKLGTKYTAYPHPHLPYGTVDEVSRMIALIAQAGERLRAAGQVLCYHNHAGEFKRVGGKVILERLYREIDPHHLQGEPDTYWVAMGGHDPETWVHRLFARLPLLHLKDFKIGDDGKPIMCEIGNGLLDFPGICAAADAAGCEWFIVEQDQCPADPFDSLRQSFEYLKSTIAVR